MGRPRKVLQMQSKHLTKAEIEARKMSEEKFKVTREQLKPPRWLDDDAQEEFLRVVTQAEQADFLDNLDLAYLAMYCNAFSRYIKVTEKIAEEGETILKESGEGSFNPIVNPLVTVQNAYVSTILKCSTKLGMATTDRLKLMVPEKKSKPENKFAKFFREA